MLTGSKTCAAPRGRDGRGARGFPVSRPCGRGADANSPWRRNQRHGPAHAGVERTKGRIDPTFWSGVPPMRAWGSPGDDQTCVTCKTSRPGVRGRQDSRFRRFLRNRRHAPACGGDRPMLLITVISNIVTPRRAGATEVRIDPHLKMPHPAPACGGDRQVDNIKLKGGTQSAYLAARSGRRHPPRACRHRRRAEPARGSSEY